MIVDLERLPGMSKSVLTDAVRPVHVELFYGLTMAEPIQIWCDCPIGRLHPYEEWVDRFQRPAEVAP